MASTATNNETILAEEQSVLNKGEKEAEGTLLLTNQRLLFVAGQQEQMHTKLVFSDVRDVEQIPAHPLNLDIPLPSLISITGHKGSIGLPNLKVKWTTRSGEIKNTEFIQRIISNKRKRNLNDWAQVIDKLRSGTLQIHSIPPTPDVDTLEGKILNVLGDMQEKEQFEIENEIEKSFRIDVDPDQIEESCERLVSQGMADKVGDENVGVFYRKRSPLGEDDLSS
jgi:hypothetical protein